MPFWASIYSLYFILAFDPNSANLTFNDYDIAKANVHFNLENG